MILFGAAIGVGIWRFEVALESNERALAELEGSAAAEHVSAAIDQELLLGAGYAFTKSGKTLTQLRKLQDGLRRDIRDLEARFAKEGQQGEVRIAAAAAAGQRRMEEIIEKQIVSAADLAKP